MKVGMRWAGMRGSSLGNAGDAGEPRVCSLEGMFPLVGCWWVLQGRCSGVLDQNHLFLQQNAAGGMCCCQNFPLVSSCPCGHPGFGAGPAVDAPLTGLVGATL